MFLLFNSNIPDVNIGTGTAIAFRHGNTELREERHVTNQHDQHEPQQTRCTKTFILILITLI
jgi:hypothetical protein